MKKKKNALLTEVELEFMNELWALGEGTVRDVLEQLPDDRDLAYTSGATILRILEAKDFVTSRKKGKSHIYTPTLAKDVYQSRSLKDLSQKLFDDTPASLVAALVNDEELSEEALGQIRALVDRRLRNDSG